MSIIVIAVIVLIEFAAIGYAAKSGLRLETSRLVARSLLLIAVIVLVGFSAASGRTLRYVGLMAALACLVVAGAVKVNRRIAHRKPQKAAKTVLSLVGTLVLYGVALLPVILFPPYSLIPASGPHNVARLTHVFVDDDRIDFYDPDGGYRQLPVEFWYPAEVQGTFPLVIFSHGALGIRNSNASLYNELASHGYVVAAIDHTYQCLYTTDASGRLVLLDRGYRRQVLTEDPRKDIVQSYHYYQSWMNVRMADIGLVIDVMTAVAPGAPRDVVALVDKTSIGVMGHSLGGSAALGVGRARADVKAVIALESPFLDDIIAVVDNSFVYRAEPYPVPLLNIYSDSAWFILGDRAQYAANHALLTSANPDSHNLHIGGAGHFDLTDLALSSPILARLLNGQRSAQSAVDTLVYINEVSLAFFDKYLKGRP